MNTKKQKVRKSTANVPDKRLYIETTDHKKIFVGYSKEKLYIKPPDHEKIFITSKEAEENIVLHAIGTKVCDSIIRLTNGLDKNKNLIKDALKVAGCLK
jgi:hypothetical protein